MSTPIISVIIPAFNEEQSIGKVVTDIPRDLVQNVIVVNNNSTDNTVQVASDAGAIVLDEPRKGYGWACLKGIEKSKELNTQITVFLDGDYSDYPEEIIDVVRPILEEDHDMVIGSRVLGKREKGSLTPQQVFGNWLATRLMRIFYRARFSDLGPFRAIKADSLEKLKMSDKTYGWTIEMQIKAAKHKMKFCEVPVKYRKRIGVSKVSGTVKGTVLAGIKIIGAIFKYRF
ncbi:MAG: UDP-glucose--dolichyl-phosphate glucosyltransferase [Fluviicola sp. XM-24bin1]|nr:MAG: UDP-glucose--dolichyl-phosphate glucosyltransferase [Fluviicola sp. XM-24bin1]